MWNYAVDIVASVVQPFWFQVAIAAAPQRLLALSPPNFPSFPFLSCLLDVRFSSVVNKYCYIPTLFDSVSLMSNKHMYVKRFASFHHQFIQQKIPSTNIPPNERRTEKQERRTD